jgi:hypothetical protein
MIQSLAIVPALLSLCQAWISFRAPKVGFGAGDNADEQP